MKAATITIRAANDALRAALDTIDMRVSLVEAPGRRGVEVHASSPSLEQKEMKAILRKLQSLLEAGEVPTGARRP